MNDLSRLLATTRAKSGRSLRSVAGKEIRYQYLANYERGIRLPEEDRLETLAMCYGLEPDEVRSAYRSATAQVLEGAITNSNFANVVESISKDDHAVVISQNAIAVEDPAFAGVVAGVLAKKATFTWVSYMPTESTEWTPNHSQAAPILLMGLRTEGLAPKDIGLQYLLLGKPSIDDFAYLQADGGTVYIARRENAEYQVSQIWSQMKAADNRRWWLPRDEGYRLKVHDWLAYSCGLDLPGLKTPPSAPKAEERGLLRLSLDEFLGSS